jgi:hypothetical protein
MKVTLMTIALSLLGAFISFGALAEGQSGQSSPAKSPLGVWEAPVGHRQPSVSEVPQQDSSADDAMQKLDRDLDKKLKSICRGC